jgi:hypothetical protein
MLTRIAFGVNGNSRGRETGSFRFRTSLNARYMRFLVIAAGCFRVGD